jgi:membrane-associated phospholipid phosphatase
MAPVTRRGTRPTDLLTLAFIVLFAAILLVHAAGVAAWPLLLLADVLVVVLLALLRRLPTQGSFAELIGGGYPFILVTPFYWQLGVMQLDLGTLRDVVVQRWELGLFGTQLSTTWHQTMPSAALSFVLHLCYGAYYWMVALVALWLFFSGKREAYRRAGFIGGLALYTCYLIFAVFPVAGPYFYFAPPPAALLDNWPARYVYFMLGNGSSMGTAFPSSHVVAAWCIVYAAWRDARVLALVLAPVALGLAVGTVYGQFHYAVDALAGAVLSLVLMAAADPLRARLHRLIRP